MSKKRPSSRRRAASATRRKAVKKTRSVKRAPSRPRSLGVQTKGWIELKPLAALIRNTIERLQRIAPTPATKRTIERLEVCSAELAAICNDPEDPDGCGTNMAFPEP